MLSFNKAPVVATTEAYIADALQSRISGDGKYTKMCCQWMQQQFSIPHALLTTSCSHALDMAARLCCLEPGDEVIMPSFTFSSTANAFVGVGAKIIFIDIRPDTMNMDEHLLEAAITPKTRVVVPVHYAGVSCEMDTITAIARQHNLLVIEDAAQGVLSTYKGKALGTLSDIGCYSFHETKNYSMGEGGALLLHRGEHVEEAEIMREKGTDRSKFFRKQVDKYSWREWGSSYLPSDINAAYLWSQLELAESINENRLNTWNRYYDGLASLAQRGLLELPYVPEECTHNAHLFYIKMRDLQQRTEIIEYLSKNDINAVYHYVPLHSAPAGLKYGTFAGQDHYTTKESERLVRLPLYYGLSSHETDRVLESIHSFFSK